MDPRDPSMPAINPQESVEQGDGGPSLNAPLLLPAAGAVLGVVLDRLVVAPQTGVWLTGFLIGLIPCMTRRFRDFGVFAAFAMLGGLWHHTSWWDVGNSEFGRPERWPAWVRGTIIDDSVYRAGGDWPGHPGTTRTVLRISARMHNDGWKPAEGRVQLHILGDRSDLNMGDRVEAMGMLSTIDGPLNPGESNFRDYLRAQGVWSRIHVDVSDGVVPREDPEVPDAPFLRLLGKVRRWSRNQLNRTIPPSAAPVASALLLGRRESIDPELNDAFARTGTTHLLAISGLHLQAVAVVVWWCARACRAPQRLAWLIVGGISLGYGALVGFAPSVVRSLVMTLFACLTGARSRRVEPTQVYSGAVLFTLIANPSNLFDVGCQLSFLAVAAIVWGVPVVLDRIHRKDGEDRLAEHIRSVEPVWKQAARHAARLLFDGVVLSTVVWFAAWPLVAYRFHVASPLGILLNVPLIPMTTVALFTSGLSLMLSGIWMPLAAPTAWITALLLGGTEKLVVWGAGQPWGSFYVPGPSFWWVVAFYVILTFFWIVGTRFGRRLALVGLGCWIILGPMLDRPRPETRVDFLAVGHGLAVLARSEGHAVLCDAGRMGDQGVGRRVIAPALWALGVTRLDGIFISHSDADHFNGIPDVVERIKVDAVYLPTSFGDDHDPAASELLDVIKRRGIPIRPFDQGDAFPLGSKARLKAIHPPREGFPGRKDNERSLVLDFEAFGRHALLTGDLEGLGLDRMLSQPAPAEGFDVVSSPHHGAKAANPPRLFEWSQPSIVVASQRPPIGLPPGLEKPGPSNSDTDIDDPLSEVLGDNARLLRTWRRGAVHLRFSESGVVATTHTESLPTEVNESRSVHPLNFYAIVALFDTWRPWIVTIVSVAVGLLLGFLIFVIEFGAGALVSPKRLRIVPEPTEGGETITVKASDGTKLVGTWFAAASQARGTLLLLHGLGEDRSNLKTRAAAFEALGWNTAILDGRGFGDSDGEAVAFGGHEADDLARWIDQLAEPIGPDAKVAVWGRSMGAAIAARTASNDPRIGALILEAPYADLHETLVQVLRRYRLPGSRMLARLILGKARKMARVPLHLPRPLDVARTVDRPTIILRGSEDRLVSAAEVNALAASFPRPVEVVEIPEAGHANIFGVGGEELVGRLARFLDESMPKA